MTQVITSDIEASGIYQIRNLSNGKRYIGSAKCFRVRWNAHRASLAKGRHHSPHLQASWIKHGQTAFVFEVLVRCDADVLLSQEQTWIDRLNPEYNVCRYAGNTLGRYCLPETRLKIASGKAGKKMPPRSQEHRERLSAVHIGRKKQSHVMDALQKGRALHVYTEAQRKKISESLKATYSDGRRSKDKTEIHRHRIGQHYANLSDVQVRQIRILRAAGTTGRELAKRYGSNPGTISEICTGKRYKWVA